MASFLDNPAALANFNPYIQTLPVEDTAKVGLIKQEQFDQGVERVQQQVDVLSSLPIAKEEVKGYVQTKLGQLKEGVTKNIAGDFSDQRIVNQIGGAARIIAKDPIVQNGVMSTARMQTALSELQEAKKAGKSAPQNEAHLQSAISGWINDGQLDSQFTGSYTPYTDITEKFIKLYKEQNPGEDMGDVYSYDPNAVTADNPEGRVVNPTLFKGKGPAKIQAIFNIVTSQPDVQQQLSIDGWYKYRGVTQNQLGIALAETANSTLKNIERSVQAMQVKIATGSTDNTLSLQIEQLKQMALDKKKSYGDVIKLLKANPDAAKAQLVKEELGANIVSAYTYQVMEKSPLWETSMEERKFQRDYAQWQADYNQKERKFEWDKQKDMETLRQSAEKLAREKKGPGSADIITDGPITLSGVVTGSEKGKLDEEAAFDEYSQAQMELTSYLLGGNLSDSPVVLDNVSGKYKFNFGPGKKYDKIEDAQNAMRTSLPTAKDAYMNGNVQNSYTDQLIEKMNQKQDNWKSKKKIVDDVETMWKDRMSEINQKIGNEDFVRAYLVEKKLPGWEGAKQSLINKYGKNWEEGLGIGDREYEGNRGEIKKYARPNKQAYQKATEQLREDPSIAISVAQREEEYRKRQSTSIPLVVTHDVSTSESREDVNTRFLALARARAVNPSTGKGDVNNILELTGKDKTKRQGLQYQSGIDPETGKAYIQVIDEGTGSELIEITRAEYERQFPERRVNIEFKEKFGARLDQTQQTSTDPDGSGRANAYSAKQPKDSPYNNVQYHLIKVGPNQYSIKWWVTPKSTPENPHPTPLINGEYASGTAVGMPSSLTEEQVVEWTRKFQDKNWLEQQMALKFLQKR